MGMVKMNRVMKIERQKAVIVKGEEGQLGRTECECRKGIREEGRGKVEGRSKGKRGKERGKRKMCTGMRNKER